MYHERWGGKSALPLIMWVFVSREEGERERALPCVRINGERESSTFAVGWGFPFVPKHVLSEYSLTVTAVKKQPQG